MKVEMAVWPPFLLNRCRKLTAFSPSRSTFVQLRGEERGFRGGLSRGILNFADQEVFPRDFKDCSFLYCIKLSYNEVAWKYNKKIGRAC